MKRPTTTTYISPCHFLFVLQLALGDLISHEAMKQLVFWRVSLQLQCLEVELTSHRLILVSIPAMSSYCVFNESYIFTFIRFNIVTTFHICMVMSK
jgi:hypothetical protein